jgi:hypothetical protein
VHEGVPHPDEIVESALLAHVSPPDITYNHHLQARFPPHAKCCCTSVPNCSTLLECAGLISAEACASTFLQDIVEEGLISSAQLEAVLYANMRFKVFLDGPGECCTSQVKDLLRFWTFVGLTEQESMVHFTWSDSNLHTASSTCLMGL